MTAPEPRPATTPCVIDETIRTAGSTVAFLIQLVRLIDAVRDIAG